MVSNMYYPNSTSVSVSIQGLRRVMGWRDPVVCCPCDDEDEVEEEVILQRLYDNSGLGSDTILPSKPACGPKCLICLSKGDLIITTGKLWWKQTKVDPLTRNCSRLRFCSSIMYHYIGRDANQQFDCSRR